MRLREFSWLWLVLDFYFFILYPAAFHLPSFSSMNATVSIADFLLANAVSNCMRTYWPSGAPGISVMRWAETAWRDIKSPSGWRAASRAETHLSRVIAL